MSRGFKGKLWSLGGALLFVATISTVVGLVSGTAAAESTYRTPTPTDSSVYGNPADTATNGIFHVVGHADYLTLDTSYFTVYATTPKVVVSIAGAAYCTDVNIGKTKDVYNSGIEGTPKGSNVAVTTFKLTGSANGFGKRPTTNTCNAGAAGNQLPSTGDSVNSLNTAVTTVNMTGQSTETVDTTTGTYYVFHFEADWTASCLAGANCGVNGFRIGAWPLSGGTLGASTDAVVSQAGAADVRNSNASNFGIRPYSTTADKTPPYGVNPGIPDPYYTDYSMYFGSDCNVSDATNTAITMYDDDNYAANDGSIGNTAQPYHFVVRLQEAPKQANPNAAPWSDATFTTSPGPNSTVIKDVGEVYNGSFAWRWIASKSNSATPASPYSGGYVNLNFTAQPGYMYRFMVARLAKDNNLQFQIPYSGFWTRTCTNNNNIHIQPTINGAVNSATTAQFVQGARVSNFPGTTHWGYDEMASQNATNAGVNWKRDPYIADNTDFNDPNPDKLGCTHNAANGTCNRWNWQCNYQKWGPGGTIFKRTSNAFNPPIDWDSLLGDRGNPPDCPSAHQHTCKNGGAVWWNFDNSGTCLNKWVCVSPNPAVGQVDQQFTDADISGNQCRIFNCLNSNDPQGFYTAPGNQPKDRCDYRCLNGTGPHAPLATNNDNRWGTGHQQCYIAPTFQIICTFNGPGPSSTVETVTKDNWNTKVFCSSSPGGTTIRSADAAGNICADTTPSGPGGVGFFWDDDPWHPNPTDPNATVRPPGKGTYAGGSGNFTDYRESWTFTVGDVQPLCFQVGAQPYFSVLGGDIAAGPGFGSSCTNATSGGVTGSNSDAAPYKGASAQLATLALGQIRSFATSNKQTDLTTWVDSLSATSAQPTSGSKLAVANYPTVGGTVYGGYYGMNNWCVPDYYKGVDETPAGVVKANSTTTTAPFNGGVLDISALATTDTTYYYDGDLTINATDVGTSSITASGQKIILKVKGNVYIKGKNSSVESGISYANPASLPVIPQFQLIAGGNIYVDQYISRLDGFYDAQGIPDGGGNATIGGIFATCADGSGALAGPTSIAPCRKYNLTVNGGVAAGLVILNRASGDFNNMFGETAHPAEKIIFSPQFWLPSAQKNEPGPWQSVVSLPPIL
jgi:hypothetical protein